MSSEPISAPAAPPSPPLLPPAALRDGVARPLGILAALIAIGALAASVLLWQRLSSIQEQLARQSADSGAQAIEARTMARQAQETAQDAATRLGVVEARVAEVALQRTQLEDLMQSLSRTRDENLVVDIESALRLAQQQTELTGSVEPMLAALRSADQRIGRAAQPRLAPVQRAITRDIDRVKGASTLDTPGLLSRLDELVRQVDDLPLQNAVARVSDARTLAPVRVGIGTAESAPGAQADADASWWRRSLRNAWAAVRDEARGLVRVSRIGHPEAVLLAPEQSFFLRENLKLKLLNARLGVLARQPDSARADVAAAAAALERYFDTSSRRVQNASALLQQAREQLKSAELPRLDDTLAALATAATGR